MSQVTSHHDTPYQRIKHAKIGEFIRDNKSLSGVTAAAGLLITGGAAAKWRKFDKIAQYTILPAAGAGLAALGGAMTHDAILNDLKDHKARATGKALIGTTLTLTGMEAVGAAYDIPLLKSSLTGPATKVFDTMEGLLKNHPVVTGSTFMLGGLALAAKSAMDAAKNGMKEKNLLGLTVGISSISLGQGIIFDAWGWKSPAANNYFRAAGIFGGVGAGLLAVNRAVAIIKSGSEGRMIDMAGNVLLTATAAGASKFMLGAATDNQTLGQVTKVAFTSMNNNLLVPAGNFLGNHKLASTGIVAGLVGVAAYTYFKKLEEFRKSLSSAPGKK